MACGRLICHDGTLYEAPELPPGADERARHVRDSLVRYGYYRLPLWEREAKFGGMVACALLVWVVRRRVIHHLWMTARLELALVGSGLYHRGRRCL